MKRSLVKKAVSAAKWMSSVAHLSGMEHSVAELEFVRTTEVNLIPRRLFKCVHDKVFDKETINRIYQFGDAALRSPTSFLYLMVDRQTREIHGVLWMNLNVFDAELFVFLMATDRGYRGGNLPTVAADFIFRQPFDWKKIRPVINFATTRPHIWESLGCSRSKLVSVSMTKGWFDTIERERKSH